MVRFPLLVFLGSFSRLYKEILRCDLKVFREGFVLRRLFKRALFTSKHRQNLALFYALVGCGLLTYLLSTGVALAETDRTPESLLRTFASFVFGMLFLFGPVVYLMIAVAIPAVVGFGGLWAIVLMLRKRTEPEAARKFIYYPALFAGLSVLTIPFTGWPMWYLLVIPAALLGAVFGYVLKKLSGQHPGIFSAFMKQHVVQKTLIVLVLAAVVIKAVQWGSFWVQLASVIIAPPNLGDPPYQTRFEREMTTYTRLVAHRYPDAQSCLEEGRKADLAEDIVHLDWRKINTTDEAEVCIFRILSHVDINKAAHFFEAQGFSIRNTEDGPIRVTSDDNLQIRSGWHIATKGPKFPEHGLLRRAFAAIPYGMSVYATWDPTGQRLLYVKISYSTL